MSTNRTPNVVSGRSARFERRQALELTTAPEPVGEVAVAATEAVVALEPNTVAVGAAGANERDHVQRQISAHQQAKRACPKAKPAYRVIAYELAMLFYGEHWRPVVGRRVRDSKDGLCVDLDVENEKFKSSIASAIQNGENDRQKALQAVYRIHIYDKIRHKYPSETELHRAICEGIKLKKNKNETIEEAMDRFIYNDV